MYVFEFLHVLQVRRQKSEVKKWTQEKKEIKLRAMPWKLRVRELVLKNKNSSPTRQLPDPGGRGDQRRVGTVAILSHP